ncbi:MAG: hypothetical protein ACNA8P_12300 [Phycisphaerales bacterium]
MNRSIIAASSLIAAAMLLGGCSAKDRFVGTWESGRDEAPQEPFDFGAVTFAPDKTYTARMIYDGSVFAETGRWNVAFGGLNIDDTRRYIYRFEGSDRVVLRDRETGVELELTRFQ